MVVFLKYFDKVDMSPNAPVWDVYYYTSRHEGKGARANPARKIKFAGFAFSRAPHFWRNLRGEGGGVVVVVALPHREADADRLRPAARAKMTKLAFPDT